MEKYLILGHGYSGKELEKILLSNGSQVVCTSRQQSGQIHFDLENKDTWGNLPTDVVGTFITMAFNEQETTNAFVETLLPRLGKVVIIGTTSAFQVDQQHQVIDENSTLKKSNHRNQAELELIKAGAICVHSAGIYGPGRSPVNWIQDGRVSANDRLVNLVHVHDLARVLIQAMRIGISGKRYVISDGNPMNWMEIIENLNGLYDINSRNGKPSRRASKRIDPSQTLRRLNIELVYTNVIQGIQSIPYD